MNAEGHFVGVPCRFFGTATGCFRGIKCRYLHASAPPDLCISVPLMSLGFSAPRSIVGSYVSQPQESWPSFTHVPMYVPDNTGSCMTFSHTVGAGISHPDCTVVSGQSSDAGPQVDDFASDRSISLGMKSNLRANSAPSHRAENWPVMASKSRRGKLGTPSGSNTRKRVEATSKNAVNLEGSLPASVDQAVSSQPDDAPIRAGSHRRLQRPLKKAQQSSYSSVGSVKNKKFSSQPYSPDILTYEVSTSLNVRSISSPVITPTGPNHSTTDFPESLSRSIQMARQGLESVSSQAITTGRHAKMSSSRCRHRGPAGGSFSAESCALQGPPDGLKKKCASPTSPCEPGDQTSSVYTGSTKFGGSSTGHNTYVRSHPLLRQQKQHLYAHSSAETGIRMTQAELLEAELGDTRPFTRPYKNDSSQSLESHTEAELAARVRSLTFALDTTQNYPVGATPNQSSGLERKAHVSESQEHLRNREVKQLFLRFQREGRIKSLDRVGSCFEVLIRPTDPDWPFVVKEIPIILDIPLQYPDKIFSIEVVDQDHYPNLFASHLTRLIKAWTDTAKDQVPGRLYLRPFLCWLDRNLLELFTTAAKHAKKYADGEAKGISVVTSEELRKAFASQSNTNQHHSPGPGFSATECKGSVHELLSEPSSSEDPSCSPVAESAPDTPGVSLEPARPRGLEIVLSGLHFSESIATASAATTGWVVTCSRCLLRSDIKVLSNSSTHMDCEKCRTRIGLAMTSSLLHAFSSILGYLQPTGCKVSEMIVNHLVLSVCCFHCAKDNLWAVMQYGVQMTRACPFCHAHQQIRFDVARVQVVHPAGKDSARPVKTKVPKAARDPAVKEGFPLPDQGTCKHYKKSFRWFRFPCCGKSFPCDICHNDKSDHEMKLANRIICGFCSKEQPFSTDKPCISCNSSFKKATSRFWEGGKGCRNTIAMSKNDSKKFSNSSAKTVSKRAAHGTTARK